MTTPEALVRRNAHHPRNLIVLRGGDGSLHKQWIAAGRRDFDLLISYYGRTPGRHAEDAEFYEMRPGPMWSCSADLVRERCAIIDEYDSVWFPDDDLAVDTGTIDRMFAFFHAYGLCLAQPALTRDSYCTWRTLRQDPRCHLRFTQFLEIMAPIFSRAALRVCAQSFAESASGWGLDWLWPRLCREAGLGRLAVIDATPVRHARPCGGELYRCNPELDPRADAQRMLSKYGLLEVRATAKYSFGQCVQEVPLPAAQRLEYWIRRLSGRRRLRLAG